MRACLLVTPSRLTLCLLVLLSSLAGACLEPPQQGGGDEEGSEEEMGASEMGRVEMGGPRARDLGVDLGAPRDMGADASLEMPGPPPCAAPIEERCRELECGASVLVCEQGDPDLGGTQACPCELSLSLDGPGDLRPISGGEGRGYRLETELGALDRLTLERCRPGGDCTPCETFVVTPPTNQNTRQGALPPGDSWLTESRRPLRLLGPTERPIPLTLQCLDSSGAPPLRLELSIQMPEVPDQASQARWAPRLWLRAHADILCQGAEPCEGAESMLRWTSSMHSELGSTGAVAPMPRARADYVGDAQDPLVEELGGLPYVSIASGPAEAMAEEEGGLAPTGDWQLGQGGAPTIFAVVRNGRAGAARSTLASNCPGASGASPGQFQIAYGYDDADRTLDAIGGLSLIARPPAAMSPQVDLFPFPEGVSSREFHLITISVASNRARWVVRRNGLDVSSGLPEGSPQVPTGGWWLNRLFGTCYASSFDVEFKGDVAEFIVSDEVISGALMNQIERYLMRKYELEPASQAP